MSEMRAALQVLVHRLSAMKWQSDLDRCQEYQDAKALLARPEPRITLGQECGTSYEVVPAPYAAVPMSPGKTFTTVATYAGMPAARPETKTYLHLEGYELANAYRVLSGRASCASPKPQRPSKSASAGVAGAVLMYYQDP